MKKLLLALLTLSFVSILLAAGPDDNSWLGLRTPYVNRLDLSAQEVLGLASRRLQDFTTGYRALEVVFSSGNAHVIIDSLPPITVTPSSAPVTIAPGTTVYIANPSVAPSTVTVVNTVTVQPQVNVTTWHEFVITSATNGILYPSTYFSKLVAFSVLSDGGSGTLSTPFGDGMVLADGVGKASPKFDAGIINSTITLSGLSVAATYYIDVFGGN